MQRLTNNRLTLKERNLLDVDFGYLGVTAKSLLLQGFNCLDVLLGQVFGISGIGFNDLV